MREFLTKGFFGAILGLCIGTSASASIISRSFLDQALTDYATTTALDLKANQSDFTDLNTQISGSVDLLRGLVARDSSNYNYEFVNHINPEKYPNTISGAFQLLYQYLEGLAGSTLRGWTDSFGTYYRGFADLNNGWTDSEGNTYLGVKGLNDKIGTLPSGDMRTSKGLVYLLPDPEYYTYPTSIGDFMGQMYGGYLGVSGLAEAVYHGNEFMGQTDTTRQVKGLRQITDEIGTLPSGSLLNQTRFTDVLYSMIQGTESPVYPNSMAELVKQIYGEFSSSVIQPGLVHLLITGFPHNGSFPVNSDEIGILPAMRLAENANSVANTANETAQANAAKIGTVPDGKNLAGMISETDAKIGTLPTDTTVAGMMGNPVLLSREQTIIPLYDLIFFGSNGQRVINPISGVTPPFPLLGLYDITHEVIKIGTLPSEYSTVGAALTAMDAKIDARELPSTSDDGQYVLSAKKVGDTITYTWVRMDLTSEEQAQ